MISQSPTRLPTTIKRLGQLMRFASTSFGTSTPAAAARRLAQRLEVALLRLGHAHGLGVQRGALQAGEDSLDRRRGRAPGRSRPRRGLMPATTATAATAAARSPSVRMAGADDEARRKSRSTGPCAVASTVSGLERAVRDPGLAEQQHGTEKAVEVVIADRVPFYLRESGPFGQPCDEGGVVGRSAPPGRHDLGDLRTGVARQEGQVRLVLHLLQAVEDERGPRVPIDAEAPHLAQPLPRQRRRARRPRVRAAGPPCPCRRRTPRPTPGAPWRSARALRPAGRGPHRSPRPRREARWARP